MSAIDRCALTYKLLLEFTSGEQHRWHDWFAAHPDAWPIPFATGRMATVGGRKVVGMSQRRTKAGALFQCACLLAWDPSPLIAALGLPAEAAEELAGVAAGVAATAPAVEAAVLLRLRAL